jgi:hypothetical protein
MQKPAPSESSALRRIVLTFKDGEIVVHALYRCEDGPNPNTKARRKEVTDLTLAGLQRTLDALRGGDVAVAGTSGFTQREDILCVDTSEAGAA